MAPRRGTGADAEADLPEFAGHYRLESRLGSGGMGVVHLARSTSGLRLAVKIVHAGYAKDPEFRGRFRQEVAAARRVSGAFTAPVVDADPEAERPWMATLFIPGPTLAEHVKEHGALSRAQLRRLTAGLAEALRDIHRAGVVHRDLKPSNVLLAEDGPKVIDFGISRPKDSELHTETGKLIGTPPFMAPEQFRRPKEVGFAADVFALGSVLVHAATGRGPFDSDSPYIVAYQVVHDEPDLTGVPEDLAPLVLRCLAKEPEDRPTPDELMRELRSVSASYDTQAFIPAQRTGDTATASGEQPRGQKRRAAGTGSGEPGAGAGDARERRPGWVRPLGRLLSPQGPGGGPRGRRRGRVALAAGAIAVMAGSAFAAAHLLDGDRTATVSAPGPTASPFSPWRRTPVPHATTPPLCVYGEKRLICAQIGWVYALSPSEGTVLWRHKVAVGDGAVSTPVLSGGAVRIEVNDGAQREALDPRKGTVLARHDQPADIGMAYSGAMTLFSHDNGNVEGVDDAGRTKWTKAIPGYGFRALSSFPGDPLVYATSTSDDSSVTRIVAVDPVSGAVRWQTRLSGLLTPVGAEDGSLVLLRKNKIYPSTEEIVRYTPALRGAHEETLRVALPIRLDGAQASLHGNTVYLLGDSGALAAVDLRARKQLWRVETSVSLGSAPGAGGGHVYFTAGDGRLLAFDSHDGRLIGQTPTRLGVHPDRVAAGLPQPLVVGDRVYAGAPDGSVFVLDGRDPSRW
ncbi:PQQ-binding-like beta-propeller repeat protein [Streptomyces sp. NPDC048664]|uniref:protein kinase domain-containing protein n=1 Tax=Streptomyces sp. NPDC048664 TaxID=3154505 RepID=UPI00342BC963